MKKIKVKRKRKISNSSISNDSKKIHIDNSVKNEDLPVYIDNIEKHDALLKEFSKDVEFESEDEDVESEVEEVTTNKPFKVKEFRKILTTKEFIGDIKHFIQVAERSSNYVAKYIEAGGRIHELVQCLGRIDNEHLPHVSYVLNSIQYVIITVISHYPKYMEQSILSCKYLLASYKNCVQNLLNSVQKSHKKTALRLLAAMVTLEPNLGRDILSTFDIITENRKLIKFTAHSVIDIKKGGDTVRTCYIHFIMAYLIEGNIHLIRQILERNSLLSAIISGLVYDKVDTIKLVLSTLSEYVLKMQLVSKTEKIQIFQTKIVQELVQLYDWKGPEYYVQMKEKKNKNETINSNCDAIETEIVKNLIHEFLVLLLTSRKHGIVFQCLGVRGKKNHPQINILQTITMPWDNDMHNNLVVKIILACPELMSYALGRYGKYLDVNKTECWDKCLNFFKNLISMMNPSFIHFAINDINAKDMGSIIEKNTLPLEIFHYFNTDMYKLKSFKMFIKTVEILHIMLLQCNKYLSFINDINKFKPHEIRKIKFDLLNHIFLNFPSVERIINMLKFNIENYYNENNDNKQLILNQLETTLDLLLIIAKTIPSFIEKTSSVINYLQILKPLYSCRSKDSNDEGIMNTEIELKAVKLIMILEPKAITPQTELFDHVIESFLKLYIYGTLEQRQEMKHLLRDILQNTGLFINGLLEIDIWLDCFLQMDKLYLSDTTQFLIHLIKTIKTDEKQCEESTMIELKYEKKFLTKNIEQLFENIENEVTLKGIMNVPTLGQLLPYALINENKCDGVKIYLESLGFRLLHYLPSSEIIQKIFTDNEKTSKSFLKYLNNWIVKDHPSDYKYGPKFVKELTKALLDKKGAFSEIFNKESIDELLENESHIMLLIYITIFYVINMARLDEFDESTLITSVDFLNSFIDLLFQIKENNKTVGFNVNENHNCLQNALNYIYCQQFHLLNYFHINNDTDDNTTKFITLFMYEITNNLRNKYKIDNINALTQHYGNKMINQIIQNINETIKTGKLFASSLLLKLLNVFHLANDKYSIVLNELKKLSSTNYIINGGTKTIYYDILCFILKKLSEIHNDCELPADDIITYVCKIYITLSKCDDGDVNLEKLEDGIFNYINVFYYCMENVPDELFEAMFIAKRLSKNATKLTLLLLQRNEKLSTMLRSKLTDNLNKKELIYPLLNTLFVRDGVLEDTKLLQQIFSEYKNGILKAMEKPQKAGVIYRENFYASKVLIEKCFPLKECVDFCKKVLKIDTAEIFQCQLLKTIHQKVVNDGDSAKVKSIAYTNFINTMLQLFVLVLKREQVDFEKVNAFSFITYNWIKGRWNHADSLAEIDYSKIIENQQWNQFCKTCLKYGMRIVTNESNQEIINEDCSVLLKLLGFLCDEFYVTDSNSTDIAEIFEMVMTHSEFRNILFMKGKNAIKTNLMYLLLILVKKNSNIMSEKHIGIYLGAYNAKLSTCDRYILAILQLYELKGISLYEYRPFVWGEAAITRYTMDDGNFKNSTLNTETTIFTVTALIDKDACWQSYSKFPIWRRLDTLQQIPKIDFDNIRNVYGEAKTNDVCFVNNILEKHVYIGEKSENTTLSRFANYKPDYYDDVYDPAFFVPLLGMFYGPDSMASTLASISSGVLGIVWAALSSVDLNMRLIAGHTLLRYKSHLDSRRSFCDKKVWQHFFYSVQTGLEKLGQSEKVPKTTATDAVVVARIPYVCGLYLARASTILAQPLHQMYYLIAKYMILQPTFDFNRLPQFKNLFHSSDRDHIDQRDYILEIIRDGLKCYGDFNILLTNNIFKSLFGFYLNPSTTRNTNLLILSIVNVTMKIPNAARKMCEHIGIIPWLTYVIGNLEAHHYDTRDAIINILNNLWYSLKLDEKKYKNSRGIELRLLHLLLKLLPHLTNQIPINMYAKYINLLKNLAISNYHYINEENVKHIIQCADVLLENYKWDIDNVYKYGWRYADDRIEFIKKIRLNNLTIDPVILYSLVTLREFIINWMKSK